MFILVPKPSLMNKILSLLAFFTLSIPVFSQQEVEVNPPDYIKTIIFKGDTQESQLPIIRLGDPVQLEFDALNGNEDDFYYEIEYFDYDWKPSVLFKNEYLNGIDNQRIRTYENSFNTYQIYSHYRLSIPNSQTRGLKVSGNYVIKVYDDYGDLVFSRKFMVYEELSAVGVAIKRSRDVAFINEKQSVDITVVPGRINVINPDQTIKTTIIQNNNLNTAIHNVKPQYTLGKELVYKYVKETAFWGGNEYLYFENKDLRAANSGIQFTRLLDLYNSYLFTNTSRKNRPYTYFPDINGNFVVTALDVSSVDIEADYAKVHFSLLSEELPGKKVYVYGNYNNYALEESNLMTYDPENGVYFVSMLLKQGFYNYKYVTVDSKGVLNEGDISGNFDETENSYKVLVYYRELGGRYDRIIGYNEGNSVNISN